MNRIKIIYERSQLYQDLVDKGKISYDPFYQPDETDAGFDIRSVEEKIIPDGLTQVIRTGLHMHPEFSEWEIQVRSRSGLASKGIFVTNGPGTIDYNYRDEVRVILTNLSGSDFSIKIGDRIAQICPRPIPFVVFKEGSVIEESSLRGGFGSSGI